MSLVIGWYFKLLRGTILVSFASTTGATMAFLLSRYLFRDTMQRKFGNRMTAFNEALDREGLIQIPLISYACKYASSFYAPFREAAGSAPQFGDRRGYQMDPANSDEAMREIRQDIEEGADVIMIKPAFVKE